MDSQTKEVMDILQEECAEVIQAVSKISRFGLDNFKPGKPKTNREHLEEELGDMMAMIDILHSMDIYSTLSKTSWIFTLLYFRQCGYLLCSILDSKDI